MALSDLLETTTDQAKPTQSSTQSARLGSWWRKAPSRFVLGEPVFWRSSCGSIQGSPNLSTEADSWVYDTAVRSRYELTRELRLQSRDGFLSVDDAQHWSKSSHLKKKFKRDILKKALPFKKGKTMTMCVTLTASDNGNLFLKEINGFMLNVTD